MNVFVGDVPPYSWNESLDRDVRSKGDRALRSRWWNRYARECDDSSRYQRSKLSHAHAAQQVNNQIPHSYITAGVACITTRPHIHLMRRVHSYRMVRSFRVLGVGCGYDGAELIRAVRGTVAD
jgi:hypothetical protein